MVMFTRRQNGVGADYLESSKLIISDSYGDKPVAYYIIDTILRNLSVAITSLLITHNPISNENSFYNPFIQQNCKTNIGVLSVLPNLT